MSDDIKKDWLQTAQHAFTASDTYFNSSIRNQIQADIRQFQGLHPSGSKYHAEANKGRSKLFRPKTRASIRKAEAVAAEAFFSTTEVVSVTPEDDSDPMQQASAEFHQALLQYRLTKSIPWFLTLMGAYQDAMTTGVVCSHQHWVYDERKKKDQPNIRLVPVENIRIDPAADWTDPINSSPYVIELVPMYIKDVKARMNADDTKTGAKKWLKLDDNEIRQAIKQYGDTVRLQREHGRTDSKDQNNAITDYTIVWVHKNIVEVDGEDWIYYTLGVTQMLSTPVRLAEVDRTGRRNYVLGMTILETHKLYPGGEPRISRDVQAEINDVTNLRIDNVKFVLNKRYLIARNRQVDIRSLMRNVPGSGTLVTDVEKDVKALEFQDVTSSSYQEQDRLNLDFDDVTGTFSGSSVQSNRAMNETVGGMEMLTTDSNQVGGYRLMTFVQTWVEPVLRQIIQLEQAYETDETIIALAGKRANLVQKYGIDRVTDDLIERELTINVDVGMGATNPFEQIKKFMQGLTTIQTILADGVLVNHGMAVDEVIREVFGKLGYRDGTRFFPGEEGQDPAVTALKATIAQLEAQLAQKMDPRLVQAQIDEINARIVSMGFKDKDVAAASVQKGVQAAFSAMQAAEVISAIPQVAPVADKVMQSAGYQRPNPMGVDPNYPTAVPPAGPVEELAAQAPVLPAPTEMSGGAPGDTSPNTPATAGTGAMDGIETQEADSIDRLAGEAMT